MRRKGGSPWKVGDKTKIICKNCKELKEATCQRRSIKYDGQLYHHILCGVCDTCGKVASVQQVIAVA